MTRLIIPGHAGIDIKCDNVSTDKHGHVWFYDGEYDEWAHVAEEEWVTVRVKARLINGVLILEDTP